MNHSGDANKMVSDTPRTDAAYGYHELIKESQRIERELTAANDRIKRLEEDLSEAYAEMRKQYPAITAVYDRSVWSKAKEDKP